MSQSPGLQATATGLPSSNVQQRYANVLGSRMAYLEAGSGRPIVMLHGNPTSSYMWRNIIPHLSGLGRIIAPDLIGMGASAKLNADVADRYRFQCHRRYLETFFETMDLGSSIVFVLHDWGSALGFDWAYRHQERAAGFAFWEAMVRPRRWNDFPEFRRRQFQFVRSPEGQRQVLEQNFFVEKVLPAGVLRPLTDEEMDAYRRPFVEPGEARLATAIWPQELPIEGEPADVVQAMENYGRWLAKSNIPKLFINTTEGSLLIGSQRDFCRTWPNLTEVLVRGAHHAQEDSPNEIAMAVAEFVQHVRGTA